MVSAADKTQQRMDTARASKHIAPSPMQDDPKQRAGQTHDDQTDTPFSNKRQTDNIHRGSSYVHTTFTELLRISESVIADQRATKDW